jgi:hypothetical protein
VNNRLKSSRSSWDRNKTHSRTSKSRSATSPIAGHRAILIVLFTAIQIQESSANNREGKGRNSACGDKQRKNEGTTRADTGEKNSRYTSVNSKRLQDRIRSSLARVTASTLASGSTVGNSTQPQQNQTTITEPTPFTFEHQLRVLFKRLTRSISLHHQTKR